MDRFRKRLGAAAAKADWDWTFIPPSTGDLAQDASWSVREPDDFHLGRTVEAGSGEWPAYLHGTYQRAPWLDADEPASDALDARETHTLGNGQLRISPLTPCARKNTRPTRAMP